MIDEDAGGSSGNEWPADCEPLDSTDPLRSIRRTIRFPIRASSLLVEWSSNDRHQRHSTGLREFVESPLILIAGESTDTRELYSLVLASQGFSVIQADDCEQALDVAMSASPDAIVLDVTSTFAGRKALQQLRANAATFYTPILILTAGAVATSEAAGYAGGERALHKTVHARRVRQTT
jgi:CheY-like chemotaxis protein